MLRYETAKCTSVVYAKRPPLIEYVTFGSLWREKAKADAEQLLLELTLCKYDLKHTWEYARPHGRKHNLYNVVMMQTQVRQEKKRRVGLKGKESLCTSSGRLPSFSLKKADNQAV